MRPSNGDSHSIFVAHVEAALDWRTVGVESPEYEN